MTQSGHTQQPWQRVAHAAGLLAADGTTRATIFAEMTALATKTGAVNLGQGFPDSDGPRAVTDAAAAAIRDGINQYPPGPGIPELRQAIAAHQERHYDISLDPDRQVLVTTGATEAIAAALLALASPGDDVLTLEPYYDSYAAVIALTGARHTRAPLVPGPTGFRLDLTALRRAVNDRTRVILLNTPHNPTGAVLSAAELAEVARLAQVHDAVVVTDEVYEHLTYDDVPHLPIATMPGAAARTLTISSAGKSFSVTGWKIGWISGPAELIEAVRTVKQFLTYTSGAPFQPAVALALGLETSDSPDADWLPTLRRSLAHRRDQLTDGLRHAGLAPVPAAGTYFVMADAQPLLAGPLAGAGITTAEELCRRLPELAGVVAVPATAFTTAGSPSTDALRTWVRFTFVKSEATIAEALRRLQTLAA
ncbi:aminotransferase class I/II-fold pyridoxal phosphate-dependent enzyme [Ruania halotolerans]|uniref:aminotransferase class I/II-fold pyridoxal phosphate-dependent enzyme n=1 Tax=Ruania halotolerans TaxID=2897773 RepID=UPI001E302516|nr:aminotransferase class I/II-fold pyridoxal phosphate-dependent enzyme [Ruania halotolerans]UFU05110.1 aminotransferase class I/II-fold pyridoxal phosphate-dependent enzyme [Ruania halotolerans]